MRIIWLGSIREVSPIKYSAHTVGVKKTGVRRLRLCEVPFAHVTLDSEVSFNVAISPGAASDGTVRGRAANKIKSASASRSRDQIGVTCFSLAVIVSLGNRYTCIHTETDRQIDRQTDRQARAQSLSLYIAFVVAAVVVIGCIAYYNQYPLSSHLFTVWRSCLPLSSHAHPF